MHNRFQSSLRLLGALLGAALVAVATDSSPAMAQSVERPAAAAERIRALFNGERARETVAFLDQYVRWPGNRGFDASIAHIARELEAAGYVPEARATAADALVYRVERYPMDRPAWEPLGASVTVVGAAAPVLEFSSNRNMLATNSWSTPAEGVTATLVSVGDASAAEWDAAGDLHGRIVFGNARVGQLFQEAVVKRGAIGVLGYALPDYLQPSRHTRSIQFASIPMDSVHQGWAIALSYSAREQLTAALARGPVQLRVQTAARFTPDAVEQTVVAEVRGRSHAEERFVFSAHVQEPGANDNASGVGAQLEMARVAATLLAEGATRPARTLTFLWGQEIRSTSRYITQDSVRAGGIRWGMSLDMVGEDTEKTGGTFLIEKMPDPSAIWTRGADRHTEWGGRPLTKDDLRPHYFNDYVLQRALAHAATTDWVVNTNPFEGGSDHTPFLRANKPGLLLWHFTDQFYHTDGDRLDKVSANTLRNVGVTALSSAWPLLQGDAALARQIVREVLTAAESRLRTEARLGQANIQASAEAPAEARAAAVALEQDILRTWASYYEQVLDTVADVELGGLSAETRAAVRDAQASVRSALSSALASLPASAR